MTLVKELNNEKELNLLNKALDNTLNESIINLTTKKIKEMNLMILRDLHLTKDQTLNYLQKLNKYRYIDEINDLKYGSFIRWIPITNPDNLPLHSGGLICDIKITDNGIIIICKNFLHKYFQIKLDECLIFQKLSSQELILLYALDHISKKN